MSGIDREATQSKKPTPQNPNVLQAWEWHTPREHYTRLKKVLPALADLGITSIWLPPGCKANNPDGNGYDCYDLWDLGEFDQKWTRSTKWGSREDLAELILLAKNLNMTVIWDAVLNHKTAGDATEQCWAVEVDPDDRRKEISPPRVIEPWIHYNFSGRGDKYSTLKWHWEHFNGTDWDQRGQTKAIFKIVDPPETETDSRPETTALSTERTRKGWADDVDSENGNADYLMFSNIDYSHPDVREDALNWGKWMISDEVGVDGFRLDAVQHFSSKFTHEWIKSTMTEGKRKAKEIFVVGEFWVGDVDKLLQWLADTDHLASLFDVPLVHTFSKISIAWEKARTMVGQGGRLSVRGIELDKVFEKALVSVAPDNAMTVVMNHDTQPGQTCDTPIAPFFKSLAYALILMRSEGLPCVFYGDIYGMLGDNPEPPSRNGQLPTLVYARKLFAYGEQRDYLDSPTSIGWTRTGTWDRSDGCAVLMSVWEAGRKKMFVGLDKAGQTWCDVLDNWQGDVVIDREGFGDFECAERSVSVFVNVLASKKAGFPSSFSTDIYNM